MIVLEMKCPQLSKPEATAARNENSIGDRMEKKPWEKPGSVGGPVPLRPDESVVCSMSMFAQKNIANVCDTERILYMQINKCIYF